MSLKARHKSESRERELRAGGDCFNLNEECFGFPLLYFLVLYRLMLALTHYGSEIVNSLIHLLEHLACTFEISCIFAAGYFGLLLYVLLIQ